MDHEKRKILLEAIGSVAIVASLIFVAWELHEVNVASRIAARDSITAGHLEFMGAVIDEDVLPTAIWKMYSNQEDDLSDFELFQIEIHHQRRWRHYERVYSLYRLGVLSDDEWAGFGTTMQLTMTSDEPFSTSSRESFENLRQFLSDEFVMYIDSFKEN